MIYVNSALQQEAIIKLLESYEGEIHFKFQDKNGLNLAFDIDGADSEVAIALAKDLIKTSEYGAALYFQVTGEN